MPDSSSAEDSILLHREGAVAWVTLNRPDKLNAFNLAMWRRLGERMAEIESEEDLRCVVISGGVSRAFGAGADMAEFAAQRNSAAQAQAYASVMAPALRGVEDCPIPTLASIRGASFGGSLELALLCDIRICGEGAKFGIPINKIGHCLPYAALRPLVALVGPSVTAEILLEGRVLSAEDALAKGLVARVVPDEALDEEVEATAGRIAAGAPLAARGHKRFIRRAMDPRPLDEEELREPYASCDTEDYREGVRAFLAKEKPRFAGR